MKAAPTAVSAPQQLRAITNAQGLLRLMPQRPPRELPMA